MGIKNKGYVVSNGPNLNHKYYSLVGAPPDTNRFFILKRNKEFLTGT